MKNEPQATKQDATKPPWRLLPWRAVAQVVEVLRFGAEKYEAHSWKRTENGAERYAEAAVRHLVAYMEGERVDAESGLHVLAHAACDVLFALWFEQQGDQDKWVKEAMNAFYNAEQEGLTWTATPDFYLPPKKDKG